MTFSHVKITSFRAKAHLVFYWCLYNKKNISYGSCEPHLPNRLYLSLGRYDFLLLGQLLLFFKKSGSSAFKLDITGSSFFFAMNRALLILFAFDA